MRIVDLRRGARPAGLFLATVLTLGLSLGLAACAPPTDAELIGNIEQGMYKVPGAEISFGEMKREFPADYKRLMDAMVALTRKGGSAADAQEQTRLFMTRFIHSIAPDAAKAPAAELAAYREQQIAMLRMLRRQSVAYCAMAALGKDLPPTAPGHAQRIALSRAQAAYFAAAAAGRRTPVERPQPGAADYKALGMAMLAGGMSENDVRTLDDPRLLAVAGADTQCRIGIVTYSAVGTLPGPVAERMMVMLAGPGG